MQAVCTRLVSVGPRVGVEALPGRRPEAPLGDEPPQDRRRREALAVTLAGTLERRQHVVEALLIGAHERRQQPAARVHPGAADHPEVNVAVAGVALLEDQARLDERLERQQLDEL